jgi:hypothetical protein
MGGSKKLAAALGAVGLVMVVLGLALSPAAASPERTAFPNQAGTPTPSPSASVTPSPSPSEQASTTTTTNGTTTTTTGGSTTTTAVSSTTTTGESTTTTEQVLGGSQEGTTTSIAETAPVEQESLARTGVSTALLTALGALFVVAGLLVARYGTPAR